MRIVTVAEYIEERGGLPSLARGRWKPWRKEGFWRLTSSKDQKHVFPRIWDEARGLAWVEDLSGNHTMVRVENLVREEKSKGLKVALDQVQKKLGIAEDKKEKKEMSSKEAEKKKMLDEFKQWMLES